MTADENAAIMRRAYEAFNTADMSTLTELFDESAVWHLPGRSRFADDYQGREATFAYFGQLGQETGGTFRANLEHVLADDEDRGIGMQRSTGERDGKRLDVDNCIVFQLKDGWSAYDPIEAARVDGAFQPGAAITSKAKGFPSSTLTVTRVEPPSLWVDESRSPGMRISFDHVLEPAEGGTRLTERVHISGPL